MDCESEAPERYQFLQRMINELRYDPLNAYKMLIREIRHTRVRFEREENKIRKDGEYFKLENTNLSYHIGQNAGIIWTLLSEEGDIDINGLLLKLNMDEKNIFSAIGWLARENKIKIKKDIYKIQ